MLLYLGWRILGSSARALPRPWAYALSHRLMDAVYRGWLPGRRALHANLQPVLGTDDPRQLERWSRRQLHRYSEYLVDALRLDALRPAECFAALETEPDVWPRLRAIYGREPILFALLHFGNWDVGGGAFSVGCGPSSVLVGPMGHPRLDRAIQAGRARLGDDSALDRAGRRPRPARLAGRRHPCPALRPAPGAARARRGRALLRTALPLAGRHGPLGSGNGRPRGAPGRRPLRGRPLLLPGPYGAGLPVPPQRRPAGGCPGSHPRGAGHLRTLGAAPPRPVVSVPPLLQCGRTPARERLAGGCGWPSASPP